MTVSSHSTRRPNFCVYFSILSLVLTLLAVLPGNASAQVQPQILTLTDGDHSYNIGRHVYLTPDPDRKETYKSVVSRYQSNARGTPNGRNLISLGWEGTPHWLVFEARNDSATEDWVLDFGHHLDGRIGVAKEIYAYDYTNGREILDAVPREGTSVLARNLNGSGASFRLNPGDQALIMVYVVPHAGLPMILPLKLVKERQFEAHYSMLSGRNLFGFSFIAAIGFFAALAYLRRDWVYGLFCALLAIQLFHFLYLNNTVFTEFTLADEMTGFLMSLTAIGGLFTTRYFLRTKEDDVSVNYLLFTLTGLLLFKDALIMTILPEATMVYTVLMTGLPMLVIAMIILMSILEAKNGKRGGYPYAMGWLVSFGGLAISLTTMLGALPAFSVTVNAYWLSLFPQLALFAVAAIRQVRQAEDEEKESYAREYKEQSSVARLKQSKKSADQQRLLRVIEREREIMAELREREARRTEEMRIAKEAADEANRAKSAFLAIVSHEIRTPMTGIMGMVRLLMDTRLSDVQHEYTQTIQDSGDAMLALLNDILDFEKIESGKMELEHVDFDLHRLLNGVVTLMSGHAAERNISLKLDMSDDVPRYVKGDPTRLRQVLLNLTGNALKFTQKGGVTLHLRPQAKRNTDVIAPIAGAENAYPLYFAVQDTGIGISKEAQKNLFSPFAQADSSISRKFGGTGLGLAICKRLIQRMGGEIKIDSAEGKGSTFYFNLLMEQGSEDRTRTDGPSAAAARTPAAEVRKVHALVVDDNEINRKVIVGLLEREGHTAETAKSAEEAIGILGRSRFDLVFMDIELPGMNGDEATRAIRSLADKALACTPVIALTGNTRDEDIRRFYKANMNGFVPKPVDPDSLKKVIADAVKGTLDNPVDVDGSGHTVLESSLLPPGEPTLETLEPPKLPGQDTSAGAISDEPTLTELSREDDDSVASDAGAVEPEFEDRFEIETVVPEDEMEELAPRLGDHAQANSYSPEWDEGLDGDDSFAMALDAAENGETEKNAPTERENEPGLSEPSREDFQLKQAEVPAAVLAARAAAEGKAKPVAAVPVFDENMLATLKNSLGEGQLFELLESLIDKADEIVDDLVASREVMDVNHIGSRAHELKGMAGNFGLTQLSKLAADTEAAAREGRTADIPKLISKLPEANAAAKRALNVWVNG